MEKRDGQMGCEEETGAKSSVLPQTSRLAAEVGQEKGCCLVPPTCVSLHDAKDTLTVDPAVSIQRGVTSPECDVADDKQPGAACQQLTAVIGEVTKGQLSEVTKGHPSGVTKGHPSEVTHAAKGAKGKRVAGKRKDPADGKVKRASGKMAKLGGDIAAGKEEEEEGKKGQKKESVRRPMNAFLIFCKRHRSIVRNQNAHLDNRSVTRILGELWAELQPTVKAVYIDLAKEVSTTVGHIGDYNF